MKDLVVVPDHSGDIAGVVSWWLLSGSVRWGRIAEICEDLGWPEQYLLDPPGASTALKRALNGIYKGHRQLIRTLPGGGYVVVLEEFVGDEKEPTYQEVMRASFDDEDKLVVRSSIDSEKTELHAAYRRMLLEVNADDFSSWVVDQAYRLKAVRLRESGGIYFVPKQSMKEWDTFNNVLRTATASKIYSLPCLKTEHAVEAILQAVNDEAEQMFERMSQKISKEELGKRALETRLAKCAEMGKKIKSYEQLLGTKMKALMERFEETEALASAALLAMEDENEEATKGNAA